MSCRRCISCLEDSMSFFSFERSCVFRTVFWIWYVEISIHERALLFGFLLVFDAFLDFGRCSLRSSRCVCSHLFWCFDVICKLSTSLREFEKAPNTDTIPAPSNFVPDVMRRSLLVHFEHFCVQADLRIVRKSKPIQTNTGLPSWMSCSLT